MTSSLPPFRVLVTRPKPEGELLCRALEEQGYTSALMPTLEIKPPAGPTLLQEQLTHLNQYHWAIFISRSAVRMSAALIHAHWPELPTQLRFAAIGPGTAESLQEAHLPAALYPESNWCSEGLLALPDFQTPTHQKIALFCGEGGRELLEESLRKRGAEVTRFVSYRRLLPEQDVTPFTDLLRLNQIQAVIAASTESLANLKQIFAKTAWPQLKKIPLVLISERIMIQAKELGFEACFLAKTASHEGILQALNKIRTEVMTSQENGSPLEITPKKSSSGKTGFLFLVVTAILIAMGFGYYRMFLLNQGVTASLLSFSDEMKWNKHQISDLQNEVTVLQQQLQQQDQVLRRQAQQLQEGQGGGGQAGLSNRGRDHSAILDAQYYVNQANNQLKWMTDVPQTLNWLTEAQNELTHVAGPQASVLKKAVADDIAALKNTATLDVTQVYLRLTALSQQVEKLPMLLVPAQEKNAAPSPALASNASFWEKTVDRISAVLRQMVVVYHLPSINTPPFITPDLRPYLYENLRASLNAALWAVLHHDSEIYHSSLQQADTWVRQYFSVNAPLTQALLTELQSLQTVSLQPAKEVVLVSPKAFEDYLKTESSPAA